MMQSEIDKKRMIELGVDENKVSVAGNLKFDMPEPQESPLKQELEALFQFPKLSQTLVFASSHPGEEELFTAVVDKLRPDLPELRAIFVPRHPERFTDVGVMLISHFGQILRRSQLSQETPNPPENKIIMLDTIGELQTVFSLATVACMGGSFVPIGGHNPLEPINARIPVIFGPHMDNFQEIAQRILESKAGFQVTSVDEIAQTVRELLTRPEYYDHVIHKGQMLIKENRGAIDILFQTITALCNH